MAERRREGGCTQRAGRARLSRAPRSTCHPSPHHPSPRRRGGAGPTSPAESPCGLPASPAGFRGPPFVPRQRQRAVIRRAGFRAGLVLALRGVRAWVPTRCCVWQPRWQARGSLRGKSRGSRGRPRGVAGCGARPGGRRLCAGLSPCTNPACRSPPPVPRRGGGPPESLREPWWRTWSRLLKTVRCHGCQGLEPRAAGGGGVALLGLASEACPVGAAP